MSVRRGGVRMLGAAQVIVDGEVHELGSNRRAALLARLAIAGGRPLSADRLADEVWGVVGPTAEGTVRVTVGRLRALLGARAIRRNSHGYALDLDEIDVDVVLFNRLTGPGDASGGTRLERLDEALALVRGRPFSGLDGYGFIEAELLRFDERLRAVSDERLALLVAAGAGGELVSELEAAVRADPLNEDRCAALMTVLYRSGRQADALAVLRGAEARVREEAGRQPSPVLQQLERRILARDPTLLAEGMSTVVTREAVVEIDAVVRSATSLARLGAFEPALRFARQGVDVARSLGDDHLLCRSLVAFARIADVAAETDPGAQPAAADRALEEAAAIAHGRADGALLAAVALARFGRGISPSDDQLAWLIGPLDLLALDAPERLSLLCAASTVLVDAGGGMLTARLTEQLDRLGDGPNAVSNGALRAAVSCFIGEFDTPLDTIDRDSLEALELAVRSGDGELLSIALHARLIAALLGGDLGEVGRLAPVIAQAGREALLPFAVQRQRLLEQAVALADGRLDGLAERIDASAELGRRNGTSTIDSEHAQRLLLALEQCDEPLLDALVGPQTWAGSSTSEFLEITRLLVTAERSAGHDPSLVAGVQEWAAHFDRVGPRRLPAAMAAVLAEIAWWSGSAALAQTALVSLERSIGRSVVLGVGTLILGPAEIFAGLCHAVLGDREGAIELLETGVHRADVGGGAISATRGRVWLAAVRGLPATIADGEPHTPRLRRLVAHLNQVNAVAG